MNPMLNEENKFQQNMEITFEGGKVVTAFVNGHTIRTDQPLDNGGENSAPCPFDLYLASIATCSAIYVKSFCDKRDIPADNIRITQETEYDSTGNLPIRITLAIQLPPDFPDKYRDSVANAAGLCTIKKSILNPPAFEIETI